MNESATGGNGASASSDLPVGGALVRLDRDDAKGFFRCREDKAAREFVNELISRQVPTLEFDGEWELLHRLLSDGTLEPEGGEPPLSWCFLGGRQMHQGPEAIISLARPDVTGHVATALTALTENADEWLVDRLAQVGLDAPNEEVRKTLGRILEATSLFYNTAAEYGSAVVFVVQL